jgi:hypothetical protein
MRKWVDAGRLLFVCVARSLDFAPVLAIARTGAALGMTLGVWHCFGHFGKLSVNSLGRRRKIKSQNEKICFFRPPPIPNSSSCPLLLFHPLVSYDCKVKQVY